MISKEKRAFKKTIFDILFLLFMIAITAYFIFSKNEIGPLLLALKEVNLNFIAIGVLMIVIFVLCEAINTYAMMEALGQGIPMLRCIKYMLINIYFCSITPSASGGQPFQILYMQKDKINISYSSLTVIVIAAVYKIVLLGYGALVMCFNRDFVFANVGHLTLFMVYGFVVNTLLVLINIVTIYSPSLVNMVMHWVSKVLNKFKLIKNPDLFLEKIHLQIAEYIEGGRLVKENPFLLIKLFFFTTIQHGVMFLVPYFIYRSFGLNEFTLIDVLSLQVILTLAVSSLPLPGAVGASESGFLVIFKTIFAQSLLVPAMLLSRGISFYLLLIVSGLFLLILHLSQKRPIHNAPSWIKQ